MVEKLDGFDLQGDGGGENIEEIDDDTLDWLRSLFEINDDESNDIVRQTNQIIRETPKISNEENEMARKLLQLNNPLGLLLSPPPYWMDSVTNPNHARTIEAGVFHESSNQSLDSSDFAQQLMSYRLRASNFAASFIKIGEWQRASRNEGDLVAKFYFVKKKLVWEFLQGPIKYKIEIPWSHIIGINAVMEKNQPGILRIELNQPPTFHEEINPQPRRHTMWKLVKDFTGMQASIFRTCFSIEVDTISVGRSLSGSQTLVSQNGIFELVWSTALASSMPDTTKAEAVILDDGNFVIRDGSNPSTIYWQSFDYLTDTWLPGAKLGINKHTGHMQRLISWKSSENPAPGMFSAGVDPNGSGQFFMEWNRSHRYEQCDGMDKYSLVPEMHGYINYSYVSNENESYFTYSLYNTSFFQDT
uniref:Uncharacterized protein n=1 Tax=Salix viminalis TaxID=40686 RepID=A0A6N2MKS9_SALVM